jgi:chaperonin GroES
MKFRPIYDRILVIPTEPEKYKGLIAIPESAQEEKETGKVVAVGPGAIQNDGHVRPMAIKVGDIIVFQRYAGFEIELDPAGPKYKVIQEEEVVGILEGAPDGSH